MNIGFVQMRKNICFCSFGVPLLELDNKPKIIRYHPDIKYVLKIYGIECPLRDHNIMYEAGFTLYD